jgi:acyl carrier protein
MLDIAERTRTIVAEQLFVDPDEVLDGASFIEDLGADSCFDVSEVLVSTLFTDFRRNC